MINGYNISWKEIKKMKRSAVIVYGMILMLLVIDLQGCAGKGRFFLDQTATAAFDFSEVKPGLNYYIIGSDLCPNVLMGLNKNYCLDTTPWKKVDMTPSLMKEMVSRMKENASTVGQNLFGYVMHDPDEKPVGFWCSTDYLSSTTSLQFRENNHVLIHNADFDTHSVCGNR